MSQEYYSQRLKSQTCAMSNLAGPSKGLSSKKKTDRKQQEQDTTGNE